MSETTEPLRYRYVSMNLKDYQADRLEELVRYWGGRRNSFLKFLLDRLDESDIDALSKRSPRIPK